MSTGYYQPSNKHPSNFMGYKKVTRDGVEWQYFEEGEFREIREEVREYQWVTKN